MSGPALSRPCPPPRTAIASPDRPNTPSPTASPSRPGPRLLEKTIPAAAASGKAEGPGRGGAGSGGRSGGWSLDGIDGTVLFVAGVTGWSTQIALEVDGRAVVGVVTSGTQTPFLKKSIGMAYLPAEKTAAGTEFEIDVRGRRVRAQVVPMPFYKRPK